MLRLVKAFWDITLWRRSPAQLPPSLFLLGLVATALGALEVVAALLPPGSGDRILTRVLLSVGLPLLFAWTVLAITRHRQRFLQTGIALLGVGVLAELLLYPLSSLLNIVGSDWASIPLMLLLCAGLVWYLLACANIWRAALDTGVGVALAVSVGYLVLSAVLEQQLLPST
jgi:hypothetical protein